MEPTYTLDADGRYVFHLRGARRFDTAEVSVLFDAEHSVLHKHGEPERVRAHYESMHQALTVAGHSDVAKSLTLVTGRFDVEELNKVVNICDYVGQFWKKLHGGNLPLMAEVACA